MTRSRKIGFALVAAPPLVTVCFAAWLLVNFPDPNDPHSYRLLLDGMRAIEQPPGYVNRRICESPEGRYVAFECTRDSITRIVVIDRQTGTSAIVPPPKEKVYEYRSIRQWEWDDRGEALYIVEDATEGLRTKAEFEALDPKQKEEQSKLDYAVFHCWKLGTEEPLILDRIKGIAPVLAISAKAGRVRLISQSLDKGWAFFDVREYRNGGLISSRTHPVTIQGTTIELWRVQLLSKHDEIWFSTLEPGTRRMWLAMMDLNNPESGATLIEPDVNRFICSQDEEQIAVLEFPATRSWWTKSTRVKYLLLRHDRSAPPRELASLDAWGKQHPPSLTAFSYDGQRLYLDALAKEKIVTMRDLATPGSFQLYEWKIPP